MQQAKVGGEVLSETGHESAFEAGAKEDIFAQNSKEISNSNKIFKLIRDLAKSSSNSVNALRQTHFSLIIGAFSSPKVWEPSYLLC